MRVHLAYFSPPDSGTRTPACSTCRTRCSSSSCSRWSCCETLGMFFGAFLREIWICTMAILLDKSNRPKSTVDSKQRDTGIWTAHPKYYWYSVAQIIRLFVCDFNIFLASLDFRKNGSKKRTQCFTRGDRRRREKGARPHSSDRVRALEEHWGVFVAPAFPSNMAWCAKDSLPCQSFFKFLCTYFCPPQGQFDEVLHFKLGTSSHCDVVLYFKATSTRCI